MPSGQVHERTATFEALRGGRGKEQQVRKKGRGTGDLRG